MANSITATSISGSETDLKVTRMIRKIAAIEITSTTLKSLSVTSISYFVQGASPISIAEL